MIALNRSRRHSLAACIAAAFALTAFAPACFADNAYDNVLNCNDTGVGSLRDTIANAGENDTIVLNPTNMHCSVITLGSGEIVVQRNNLTVKYNADNTNLFTIAGSNHRVFNHRGTGTLKLQRLGIELGKYTSGPRARSLGGCIYSKGTVDLEYSSVEACKVTGNSTHSYNSSGGGIYAATSVVLNHSTISDNSVRDPQINYQANGGGAAAPVITAAYSTISGNSAGGYGGGLFVAAGSNQASLLKQCTISGNTSHRGGGVSTRASVTILESTISGNSVTNYGSGMFVDGAPALIYNSTIAFNHSSVSACGIAFFGSGTYSNSLQNTIVANNTYTSGSFNPDCDVIGPGTSSFQLNGSHNIVMRSASVTLPSDTLADDPLLLPLANNGGPTQTHAFRDGSPAFGAGLNLTRLTTDQRGAGFARTVNGATDIGAFEQQVRDVIFADGFD